MENEAENSRRLLISYNFSRTREEVSDGLADRRQKLTIRHNGRKHGPDGAPWQVVSFGTARGHARGSCRTMQVHTKRCHILDKGSRNAFSEDTKTKANAERSR